MDSLGNLKISEKLKNRLSTFREVCRHAGITMMNETRYSVEQYTEDYEKILDRSILKDLARGSKVTLLQKTSKYAREDPQVLTDGAFAAAVIMPTGSDLTGMTWKR